MLYQDQVRRCCSKLSWKNGVLFGFLFKKKQTLKIRGKVKCLESKAYLIEKMRLKWIVTLIVIRQLISF